MVRLDDGPGGSTLHLVGVSHVLVDDAARDIRALMRRLDAVVLELCAERAGAMAAALAGVSADTASPPAVIPAQCASRASPQAASARRRRAPVTPARASGRGRDPRPRSDRDALMALGHFREVDVDVLVEDAGAAAAALVARLDSPPTRVPIPRMIHADL